MKQKITTRLLKNLSIFQKIMLNKKIEQRKMSVFGEGLSLSLKDILEEVAEPLADSNLFISHKVKNKKVNGVWYMSVKTIIMATNDPEHGAITTKVKYEDVEYDHVHEPALIGLAISYLRRHGIVSLLGLISQDCFDFSGQKYDDCDDYERNYDDGVLEAF